MWLIRERATLKKKNIFDDCRRLCRIQYLIKKCITIKVNFRQRGDPQNRFHGCVIEISIRYKKKSFLIRMCNTMKILFLKQFGKWLLSSSWIPNDTARVIFRFTTSAVTFFYTFAEERDEKISCLSTDWFFGKLA
jgi:hypothetical protein